MTFEKANRHPASWEKRMQIRIVQSDDFDAINNLNLEANESDSGENADVRRKIFESIVEDPRNHIFAGVVGNEIVSTCYLNIIPNITWGPAPYALIENVVTTKLHRRKGYGRECIAHAIDYAFSNEGCFKVLLLSSQRNEQTRSFYKSAGLEQSKDGYVIYKQFI